MGPRRLGGLPMAACGGTGVGADHPYPCPCLVVWMCDTAEDTEKSANDDGNKREKFVVSN